MKRSVLLLTILSAIIYSSMGQNNEISLKWMIFPIGITASWHYSLGIESPALGNFSTQTTFNYLNITDSESETPEINKRRTLLQEFRYYITPVIQKTCIKFYVYAYPRICFRKAGREESVTNPAHEEFSYGGGGGAGLKFLAKKRLYLDFNLGCSYFNTQTKIKSADTLYEGWLPKINLVLCYSIGIGKKKVDSDN